MVRILGLDPGEKRIGVAISDSLGITAQGLEVINYTEPAEAFNKIEKICLAYDVQRIVVGNPLNMSGREGPAAEAARLFAEMLQQKLHLEVIMVDERLSSVSADKTLAATGAKRKKRRKIKDMLAAALILETYLSAQQNNCD